MADLDLCRNCNHWREEHYGVQGEWQGQLVGCSEYQGGIPTEDRAGRKPQELAAARRAVQQKKDDAVNAFYALR